MKTVIEMAKEAGFTEGELAFMGDNFIRFAELVRADERARMAEQPAPVQGWKLVPVDPTIQMCLAGAKAADSNDGAAENAYYAMLAAAPQPAQRTWVGLTDDDLETAMEGAIDKWDIAEAIEAKLREKNKMNREQIYKAWQAVGADAAGLMWEDFVKALAAPVQDEAWIIC